MRDFATDDGSVTIELDGGDATVSVDAFFLVGCDGARSEVRKQLGVGFAGRSYPESLLVADCEATGLSQGFSGVFFTKGGGFLAATGMTDALSRIGATVEPDFEATDGAIIDLVSGRSCGRIVPHSIEWSNLFQTHRRRVERMRHGRVVLAGDAAHVHSPALGRGMNLGIRDAFDLGHRLAAHLAGTASIDTLDEYDEQRRSEAAAVLTQTHRMLRLYTARGVRRRVADAFVRLGDRVDATDRIMIAMSGIDTSWPPGVHRPEPTDRRAGLR